MHFDLISLPPFPAPQFHYVCRFLIRIMLLIMILWVLPLPQMSLLLLSTYFPTFKKISSTVYLVQEFIKYAMI